MTKNNGKNSTNGNGKKTEIVGLNGNGKAKSNGHPSSNGNGKGKVLLGQNGNGKKVLNGHAGHTTKAADGTLTPTLEKEWAAPLLESLAEYANVSHACREANIDKSHAYAQKRTDKAFSAAWDAALDAGIATLENALRKRAIGIEVDVFDKNGQRTGTRTQYSDVLGIFLLKAHRPDVYRERLDINTTHSGNIGIDVSGLSQDEARAAVRNRIAGIGV